jgi:hypothetical protein
VIAPVGDLASKIAGTDFVPKDLRGKPAAVAAAILYGREVGLPPMSALKSINVIHGTPSLEAEAMRALILAAGHELRFEESTATRCILMGRRRGSEDWTTAKYTIDEAKQSGDFNKNPNYKSRPTEMLIARATSRLARMLFADVIGGLQSPEEIDQAEPVAAPAKVTVQREDKPKPTPRKKSTPPPKPVAAPEPVAIDGPPLPGEDGFEDVVPTTPEPAPEEIIDGEVIEETGEAITAPQMKKLHATLRDLGIDNRDDGLKMIGDVLGEPVESTKSLTKAQASMVIDTLSAMQAQGEPAPF